MNIDSLNIQIKSSATDARKSIDDLVTSLKNLNKQLGFKEGTKLATTLKTISSSAVSASTQINKINGTGLEKVSKNAEIAQRSMQQLVKEGEDVKKALEGFKFPDFDKYFSGVNEKFADSKSLEAGTDNMLKSFQTLAPETAKVNDQMKGIEKSFNEIGRGEFVDVPVKQTQKLKGEIEQLLEKLREYKKVLSEMKSGKRPVDENEYKEAIIGYDQAKKAIEEYNKAILKAPKKPEAFTFTNDILPSLLVLGRAFDNISQKLNGMASKSANLFKAMLTPLKLASKEYVEKFENMRATVSKFQQHFQVSMTKVSQFWAKTMRTFTFMLVRKAITAILSEVNNAIKSLAQFSNAMGTQFNQSISNLVADFQYLGRSIVSVFAPLIETVTPIIDALVEKIATLLSYIGMLFAALGGSASFTKAKKNVTNYGAAVGKAAKSVSTLTMGIDELNILSENKGGGSGAGDNPLAGWENVEIPSGIKKLADALKKMWADFLKPIKAAWDKMKDYVKEAWTYMLEQVMKLGKSIWDAFIQVWNEPETIEMIANIFGIIADLMMTIGNLCKNFRESWDEVVNGATRGVQIFRAIRDIFAVLIEHVRNVTMYMVEWSEGIDFSPLLDSVIMILNSFYRLADFIGGVFEDVMKNVVLEYIEWMIEEGIPHLNHTIAEVLDAFNFDKIRSNLVPVENAFINMLENIHTGVTNAMGNLGKQIADFTNSQQFTDFMQRIADIMGLISAEDVEKILTGLGQGILDIADAIVKFVNSETFMKFLEAIDKWLENASSEDIAGILKGVAVAIGLFKFGAFVSGGAAKFIGFLASFGSLIKVVEAVSKLVELAGGIEAVGAALEVFGGINAIIVGSITAIAAFFKMWNKGWSVAGEVIKDIGIALAAVGAVILGVTAAPAAIVAAVVAALTTAVIVIHDHWDQIVNFFTSTVPAWWEGTAVPFLKSIPPKIAEFLSNIWKNVTSWASTKASAIGKWFTGIGEKISGFVSKAGGYFQKLPLKIRDTLILAKKNITEWGSSVKQGVSDKALEVVNGIAEWFSSLPEKVGEGLSQLKEKFNEFGSVIATFFSELPEKLGYISGYIIGALARWVVDIVSWARENIPIIIENIANWFKELPPKIAEWLNNTIDKFAEWASNVISWIATNVSQFIENIVSWFRELPAKIYEWLSGVISKFVEWGSAIVSWIATNVSQFIESIVAWFSTLPARIYEWLSGVIAKFVEWGSAVVSWIAENVSRFIENIVNWFKQLPEKIWTHLVEIITKLSEWYNNAVTWITINIPLIVESFLSFFREIPQKLFDLGISIIQGLLDGINKAWDTLKGGVADFCSGFIQGFKDAFGIASPSKEAADIGDYWLEGLVLPLQGSNINDSVAAFAEKFIGLFKSYLSPEKFTVIGTAIANAISVGINNGLGAIAQTLNNIYLFVVQTINTQINTLSTNLQTILLPMFANIFTQFTAWFNESMNAWWADSIVFWFTAAKWDEDIFTPLAENIHEHFETFSTWWDTTMTAWWEDQVVPWFEKEKWSEQYKNILDVADETFTQIEKKIKEHIQAAEEAIDTSCNNMKDAIRSVMDEIDELIEKMKQVPSEVTFHGARGFASGGFPSSGSLFFANEAGPELVGTIHGNTAVANNNEITGIREAILASGNQESELLARLITITQALLDKEPVVIDDRNIARMATSGQGRLGMNIIT